MESAGFIYEPVEYMDSDGLYRQLNPLQEDVWRRYGYGEPPAPEPPQSAGGSAQYFERLQGPGGCSQRALAFVYNAPFADQFSMAQGALVGSADQARSGYESTDEGAARILDWSTCMGRRGYHFRTPGDARRLFEGEGVDEEELATREADFECDVEVRLTEGRSRWESARFDEWAHDHATHLSDLTAMLSESERELTALEAELSRLGDAALPQLDSTIEQTTVSTLPRS